MRQVVKNFVKIVAENLPLLEPIYEFGSFQVRGQEGIADLRPLFTGKKYIGADLRQGRGVDVICNMEDTKLGGGAAGTVLCLDTLEHVRNPIKAIQEMFRILNPQGFVVVSSCMNFPIHEHPGDYWRFTPAGLDLLLFPFAHKMIGYLGQKNNPHTVVGIASATRTTIPASFVRAFDTWKMVK
jgi:SAM-dependent methyltransferase